MVNVEVLNVDVIKEENIAKLLIIIQNLKDLESDDERYFVISEFCHGCGSVDKYHRCWDDE